MVNKRPCLIDLRHFIIGTYVGKEPSSKEGYVYVKYIPLGSFTVNNPITTEEPVPKESIVTVDPDDTTKPGVEQEYKVITEDADGQTPILDRVMKLKQQRVKELRDELERQETEKAQHKRERIKSQRGQKELEKEENERNTTNSNTPNVDVDKW